MANNLRIGHTSAYQTYREIEPLTPYPRVDGHQPREEYPSSQQDRRGESDEPTRRRFRAMRRLIDEIKRTAQRIVRVDYSTAEQELLERGLWLLNRELPALLQHLQATPEERDDFLQQLHAQRGAAEFRTAEALTQDNGILPLFVPGLHEYTLCFPPCQIRFAGLNRAPGLQKDAPPSLQRGPLTLIFQNSGATGDLLCYLIVRVAVSETDDVGRRVLFYPQSERGCYSLYADKQINLSI